MFSSQGSGDRKETDVAVTTAGPFLSPCTKEKKKKRKKENKFDKQLATPSLSSYTENSGSIDSRRSHSMVRNQRETRTVGPVLGQTQ